MAPRPSPTSERAPARSLLARLTLAGLVALALLGLGEAAPAAAPVEVAIEAHGPQLSVDVDGQQHELSSALGGSWRRVDFESPGPLEREYQIDGSDTTSTNDRRPTVVLALLHTPLYAFDAWLRDESSYSRWERTALQDLTPPAPAAAAPSGAGTAVAQPGGPAAGGPAGDGAEGSGGGGAGASDGAGAGQPGSPDPAAAETLPAAFRVTAALRRPEAAARIWLLGTTPGLREGLELDRDRRNARWLIDRQGVIEALPRWFFPEQPWPFAAELLHLLGRSAAAGWCLAVAAVLLVRLQQAGDDVLARRGWACDGALARLGRAAGGVLARLARAGDGVLALWLLGAGLLTTLVYHQRPHILDAVSYMFQAGLFARGALWLDAPSLVQDFRGPFEVVTDGRWFSQYPPGAPAVYALGQLVGLGWLVGPIACAALIGATAWSAGALFGPPTGLVVLLLGALSPFVLFQSGSFLSHPIAGGMLGGALASFVAGERSSRRRWFVLCGALLGGGFLAREAASALFALPLVGRLAWTRRWRDLATLIVAGLPFALLYLLYNAALTGSPWTLPRSLFDPTDRFGFGDGIGFHTRHTLAAGLANADELLTLLQFDALGWPPLFTFGLLGLPFLLGRARAWDWLALGGLLAFVVAYVGYFYHGVALGPRYYFESMPWLLLLAGRGGQVLAQLANSRLAAGVVLGLLTLNTLGFYVPAEVARRLDFSGLPDARPLQLAFVRGGLSGPELAGVPRPALVLTDDWWIYNAELASLNCASLPSCPVLFGLAVTDDAAAELRAAYPERTVVRAIEAGGQVVLQLVAAPTAGP